MSEKISIYLCPDYDTEKCQKRTLGCDTELVRAERLNAQSASAMRDSYDRTFVGFEQRHADWERRTTLEGLRIVFDQLKTETDAGVTGAVMCTQQSTFLNNCTAQVVYYR